MKKLTCKNCNEERFENRFRFQNYEGNKLYNVRRCKICYGLKKSLESENDCFDVNMPKLYTLLYRLKRNNGMATEDDAMQLINFYYGMYLDIVPNFENLEDKLIFIYEKLKKYLPIRT